MLKQVQHDEFGDDAAACPSTTLRVVPSPSGDGEADASGTSPGCAPPEAFA
jgi:hypothetical protein